MEQLSQDMYMSTKAINEMLTKKEKARETEEVVRKTIDRHELPYLPEGHSIELLELEDFSHKYQISNYLHKSQQRALCVTVLSHNNIQNNRYLKLIKSIAQQKYENYYVVFIDDHSIDENMNASIQYFREINFPKERLTFVQNKKQMFATYNILNAAFNFCNEDDLQVLIDGDDEIIGKYVFHVINAFYKNNPETWVAYSNYITNFYQKGYGNQLTNESS
jgi:hypothetical protein